MMPTFTMLDDVLLAQTDVTTVPAFVRIVTFMHPQHMLFHFTRLEKRLVLTLRAFMHLERRWIVDPLMLGQNLFQFICLGAVFE